MKDIMDLIGEIGEEPKVENKEQSALLHLADKRVATLDLYPDLAIAVHVRNLFATYGEEQVKKELASQFGLVG
jgi:hypothetical protein